MATWTVEPYFERRMREDDPDVNQGEQNDWGCLINFIDEEKSLWARAIVEFDLSAFPGESDGSDITSVTLDGWSLATQPAFGYDVDFRRCTQPALAVASEVTWNEYSTGNSWSTAGGSPTATDKVTLASGSYGLLQQSYLGFETLTIDALVNRSNILSLINRFTSEADDAFDRDFVLRSTTDPTGPAPILVITYGVSVAVPIQVMTY